MGAAAGIATGAFGTYAAMGGFSGGVTIQEGEINLYGPSEEDLRAALKEREDRIVEEYKRIGE